VVVEVVFPRGIGGECVIHLSGGVDLGLLLAHVDLVAVGLPEHAVALVAQPHVGDYGGVVDLHVHLFVECVLNFEIFTLHHMEGRRSE